MSLQNPNQIQPLEVKIHTIPSQWNKGNGIGLVVELLPGRWRSWAVNCELGFSVTLVKVGGVRMHLYSVNHSFPSVRLFVRNTVTVSTMLLGNMSNRNPPDC